MKRVLVHGSSQEAAETIIKHLEEKILNVEFVVSDNLEKTENFLQENVFALLILDAGMYTKKYSRLIVEMNNWGLNTPSIVLCKNISPTQSQSKHLKMRPYFLESQYEPKKLVGVSNKLLKLKTIPQQVYTRYHTNQLAEVISLKNGASPESSMYNLSKGGAYLEFTGEERVFRKGDVVSVSIQLNDLEKTHEFSAKVIWTTDRGRYSGRQGVGIQFLKSNDHHTGLLEGL